VVSFLVAYPYGDGLSSLGLLVSPQSHTPMYIVESLSNGKCNMMSSHDKSLSNVIDCWITFMMHKNAQANFTHVRLNVMRQCWDSKFNPPLHKSSWLTRDWFWSNVDFGWNQHLSKHAYVPPQYLHGFCMDGIKLYDTWMISGTSQCLHRKSSLGFIIILTF
jgi:hypothetical protein